MIEMINKEKCTGCKACYNICPKECIEMVADYDGFLYPHVDLDKCIDCGLCEKACHIYSGNSLEKEVSTRALAAYSKNEDVRMKSSSGGIFTLISEYIIDQGGVVFGAALTEDYKYNHHICVDKKKSIDKLRGSKYIQSDIGETYSLAKQYLEEGRKVLFTGTPCQIGGLLLFLNKDYSNLYTQDLICHGVPSPAVWKKYVEEREHKAGASISNVSFRHKKYGWKNFSTYIQFDGNCEYIKKFHDDSFMRAFSNNLCLRPSCYACSYKGISRPADVTLADFWGIQNVLPEMDDDKGTSLVLIHSSKGEEILNKIKEKIVYKNISIDSWIKYNSAAISSCESNKKREEFFNDVRTLDFDKVVAKYTRENIIHYMRRAGSRIKRLVLIRRNR